MPFREVLGLYILIYEFTYVFYLCSKHEQLWGRMSHQTLKFETFCLKNIKSKCKNNSQVRLSILIRSY